VRLVCHTAHTFQSGPNRVDLVADLMKFWVQWVAHIYKDAGTIPLAYHIQEVADGHVAPERPCDSVFMFPSVL